MELISPTNKNLNMQGTDRVLEKVFKIKQYHTDLILMIQLTKSGTYIS